MAGVADYPPETLVPARDAVARASVDVDEDGGVLQDWRVVVQVGEVLLGVGFCFCDGIGLVCLEPVAECAVRVAGHEALPFVTIFDHGAGDAVHAEAPELRGLVFPIGVEQSCLTALRAGYYPVA